MLTYYNHTFHLAGDRWGRASFAGAWWRLYAGDPRWVPPYYPALRRDLDAARSPHLARLAPTLLRAEAIARPTAPPSRGRQSDSLWTGAGGLVMDETVAAAVLLCDPRRGDRAGYLALLHCVNDLPTLARLLDRALEEMAPHGCRRLLGPVGLSPHLGSGLLEDSWDELPPLHTAYNPPYLPDLAALALTRVSTTRLYHLPVPPDPADVTAASDAPGPATLRPLDPLELFGPPAASGLAASLLVEACSATGVPGAAPPDAAEAAYLLRALRPSGWPLSGWLAEVAGRPVGFVLVQPDLSPLLHRAGGARRALWRLWLARATRRPHAVRAGRLLYGAVLPDYRGRGIGRRLLHQALAAARDNGWTALNAGPFAPDAAAAAFLQHHGAEPRQAYGLYQRGG